MLKLLVKSQNILKRFGRSQKGEGVTGLVITVAAVLVIGGLIFIPQLKTLSTTIMTRIDTFWDGLSTSIFAAN